jgi:hypothetical protein
MVSKLPPGTCPQCGKTISRKVIANVFEERIGLRCLLAQTKR